MRKLVSIALTVGLLTLVAANLSGSPDKTADLKKADQDWAKSVAARNLDQFMSFVRDDAYLCGLDGKWRHGKDAVKADWTPMMADQSFQLSWTIESADVSKDGSLGYTRGTFSGSKDGKPFSGAYSTVWQKDKDGKWRAQVDMATA